MHSWTSIESSNRLLAAIFAVYDIKPGANLNEIASYYGNEITAKAMGHRLYKVKSEADQMKLGIKPDAFKEDQIAGLADKKSVTVSQPQGKSTKSRASVGKSNGVVNGRVKKTATRGARKTAPPGIAAAIMDVAVANEEDQVGYVPVNMETEYEESESGEVLYEGIEITEREV